MGGNKMSNTCSIILAAGDGKRMKSEQPKVLSEVLGKPMIKWVLDALEKSNIKESCVVAGYKREKLIEYLKSLDENYEVAIQSERKGTGHAVMMAEDFLKNHENSDVLILNGDAPFIDNETIKKAYNLHKSGGYSVTVVSSSIMDPTGYGRIIRDNNSGMLSGIIEHKDANEYELKINEVNSGVYWFKVKDLLRVLFKIKNQNSQGEYYLPDAVSLLIKEGFKAGAFLTKNSNTVLGANDCIQLSQLNKIAQTAIIKNHMKNGVNIPFPENVIIGPDVEIKGGSTIYPGSIIIGKSIVGTSCKIGPNSVIINCAISNNVNLNAVHCENSTFSDNENYGPFKEINSKQ